MSGLPPPERKPRKRDWILEVLVPILLIMIVLAGGMHEVLSWVLVTIYLLWLALGWRKLWKARDQWREWHKKAGVTEKE